VDESGKLVGLITRGDLVRALDDEDNEGALLRDIGSAQLVVTHTDELLEEATAKMITHDIGRLPVVAREDPTRLVGLLGRAGVMAVWRYATREEQTRDSGWLSHNLRALRGRIARRVRSGGSGNGGA
jgi:CBS-domain-containing membrane protein